MSGFRILRTSFVVQGVAALGCLAGCERIEGRQIAVKPAIHVRANVTADGLVLLDIESGSIFSANRVGARIWELLEAGQAEAAIAQRIAEEFDTPHRTVERDVQEFITALKARQLVAV
jgi:hypothetical protein